MANTSPGMPVAWMTQVSVTDADETAAKIAKAGGQVIVAPMDVFTQGRFAVVTDQAGAPFGLWQPRDMSGADIFNVDGAYTWSELTTRDPLGSKDFYREVFGWEAHDRENGPVTYTTFKVDGSPAAGLMPMEGDMWPADLPNHWMVYFAVDDHDAKAKLAEDLGGAASVPPQDIAPGRFAVLNDPQGAYFSIIKMNPDFLA